MYKKLDLFILYHIFDKILKRRRNLIVCTLIYKVFDILPSMIGVLVGGILSYYTSSKITKKKFKIDKQKKLFENNLKILKKMKINNLEISFQLYKNRGFSLNDFSKTPEEKHAEYIVKIPLYSFENLKLSYSLEYEKEKQKELIEAANALFEKMIEIQKSLNNGNLSKISVEDAKNLLDKVNKKIEIIIESMIKQGE